MAGPPRAMSLEPYPGSVVPESPRIVAGVPDHRGPRRPERWGWWRRRPRRRPPLRRAPPWRRAPKAGRADRIPPVTIPVVAAIPVRVRAPARIPTITRAPVVRRYRSRRRLRGAGCQSQGGQREPTANQHAGRQANPRSCLLRGNHHATILSHPARWSPTTIGVSLGNSNSRGPAQWLARATFVEVTALSRSRCSRIPKRCDRGPTRRWPKAPTAAGPAAPAPTAAGLRSQAAPDRTDSASHHPSRGTHSSSRTGPSPDPNDHPGTSDMSAQGPELPARGRQPARKRTRLGHHPPARWCIGVSTVLCALRYSCVQGFPLSPGANRFRRYPSVFAGNRVQKRCVVRRCAV
jgi:hypothetical protein